MDRLPSIFLSDEQLMVILDETADWAVNGTAGIVVSHAASLRDAILAAGRDISAGREVRAVTRLAPNRITVFRDQIARLVGLIAIERTQPIRKSEDPSIRGAVENTSAPATCPANDQQLRRPAKPT
jgi:hypothetical protein